MDDFRENVIEWLNGQEYVTATFNQQKFINKLERLAQKYPDECQIVASNNDGSIVVHIPLRWIKINPPRQITDEQKVVMGERLASIRTKTC